ncbi:hypothetical protein FOQG_19468 [Fusarium oxysporum f. sp. raphani 54005]|uniref:Heterokaryon incompatibility domain-containing protein n=1 Tax=Fusarium oxysporum f. sp. raphani 54005 TaxID=1089458 RepID=X0BZ10_FUSOX|nr:hypothetical protein FOQG_19468 [Fusarium oxysporum f. sp. raphani 54005]
MNDDSDIPLSNIVKYHGKSIASFLVEIGESKLPQKKWLSFIEELECLSIDESSRDGTKLIRHKINAFEEQDYVALSYTWDNSDHESPERDKYKVETRDKYPRFLPSPVRDCIFDRVFSFMRAKGLHKLWIDRHCVRQKTCKTKGTCLHNRCKEKQRAIETMDLVYSLSKRPVALLGRPIEWEHELDLLFRILTRKLVKELSRTKHDEILQALSLLSRVTKDRWWTRAWTFQENYRGRPKMTLLIRHPQFLESKKRDYGIFDNVPNELCIKAVCFSQASTDFCRAIPDELTQRDDVSHHTKHILGMAGKYTQLLDGKMSMTPKVIDDIQRRSLRDAWDKLAIIANCCQYNIRMDPRHMKEPKSLSMSILAMCILNGEILVNESREDRSSMLEKTMSQFLEEQAFREFCAPRSQRDLTFNKGCRFVDVEITPIGIKTKGHFWKLDIIIDTSTFRLPLPEAKKGPCSATENEQRRLAYLASELRRLHETTLAIHIERFLNNDHTRPDENSKNEKFSVWYMRIMAKELAEAIEEGKLLRLGRIWDPIRKNPCSAIFIWNSNDTENIDINGKPYRRNNYSKRDRRTEFAFTASRPLQRGFQQRGTNDLDHHVSLQVQRLSLRDKSPNDHPQLFIKRWLVGLCFFYDVPRRDVVFPWPSSFHTVGH